MTRDEVDAIEKRKASEKARFRESTAIFQPEYTSESEPTAISEKTLKTIVDGLTRVPEGFEVQPKIERIVIDYQRQVFEDRGPYPWHCAAAPARLRRPGPGTLERSAGTLFASVRRG